MTIFFATFGIAKNLLFPGAVSIFSAREMGNARLLIGLGTAVALVGSIAGAVAHFLSFHYQILDAALVVDSGVFFKKHRVIPLESIQNVEVRESALQRVFGVSVLKVETATGGIQADAEFSVLKRETADALRDRLLALREGSLSTPGLSTVEPEARDPGIELARLSARDLVVAGATANRAGVVFAAIAGGYQLIDNLPYPRWIEGIVDAFPDTWTGRITLIAGTLLVLVVVGWVLSIIGSFLRYHGFTLIARDQQLHISHGLVSRHKTVLPIQRVQALSVEESILRRPFSLAAMRAEAAGSAQIDGTQASAPFIVPISTTDRVPHLVKSVFQDVKYADITLALVHPRSKSRAFTHYALTILLATAGAAFWRFELAALLLLLLPFAWLLAGWQYRHRGHATVPGYVVARNGVFNRITWLVPEKKMQTLHLRESPFQRRHGLASVVFDTAGSGRRAAVKDVTVHVARQLLEHAGARKLA